MAGDEQLPEGIVLDQVEPQAGQPGMPDGPEPQVEPAVGQSRQWDWRQVYVDPPNFSRTMGPGLFGITIASGPFPPGYRVANGRPGGGFPPAGAQSNGTLPIKIQPPISGTGRLTFVSHYKVRVGNVGSTVVQYSIGMGVADVNGPSRPMFPYLGVAHDQDPVRGSLVFTNIRPGEFQQLTGFRLDIVDNAFASVPNWPNWQMEPGRNLLWPAVVPIISISGGSLMVLGVFCKGFAV